MNRISYSLLLLLLTPLILLYLGYRATKSIDYRGRIGERFSFGLPKLDQPIIIHCASMGETLAALPLIQRLQQQYPTSPLLVTTTTPTGSAQVKQHLGTSVYHCYLPLDFSWATRRFVAKLKPKAVILMETELWPNLVHHCSRANVPVIVANARLSERSAASYQKLTKVVTPMLQQLTAVAVQHADDGNRFVDLGLAANKITECGSLKFDIHIDATARQQGLDAAEQLGNRPKWIAASTHPGEFEQALAAHQQLLSQYPDLLLIIVPRHPEQFDHAAALAQKAELKIQRRSETLVVDNSTQVLIGDTMGELKTLYGASDIAFVGGSMIERGGHNPLEPAAFGKPVLMGPHYYNFQQIGDALKAQGVMSTVDTVEALQLQVDDLIQCKTAREGIAALALEFVAQNSGATDRQLEVIQAAI